MSFSPKDQRSIDEARQRMRDHITHDVDRKTIRVGGMDRRAWMRFSYEDGSLTCDACAPNIQYTEVVTGVPTVPWHEVNAAWDLAHDALEHLAAVPPAVHGGTDAAVWRGAAAYLAMKDRVDRWGGFEGEKAVLPAMYETLSDRERALVDRRLRGEALVP